MVEFPNKISYFQIKLLMAFLKLILTAYQQTYDVLRCEPYIHMQNAGAILEIKTHRLISIVILLLSPAVIIISCFMHNLIAVRRFGFAGGCVVEFDKAD